MQNILMLGTKIGDLGTNGLDRLRQRRGEHHKRLVIILITTTSWRLDKPEDFFLQMDSDVIKGIPLCTWNQHDFWAWHYECMGIYSVTSTYRMHATTKELLPFVDWNNGARCLGCSASSLSAGYQGLVGDSVQITKKLLPTEPRIAQHLSRSNVVTINGDSVTYPCRPNAGITLSHKR
jgi:hypothetical protein